MFPFPSSLYVKIGVAVLFLCSIYFAGWHSRNKDYMAFKANVEETAKAQEVHIESIKKQQDLVTKGIQNEYDAKIAAIRNYYKSTSVWNGNGSKMSGISTTPSATDVIASYNQLASSCAETTQQLVSLQEWINAQIGIK